MLQENDPSSPQFLTTREVADLLRVKERKVYDLAAANEIPHRRITGKLLFPASEIHAWIEGSGEIRPLTRPDVVAGSHDPLLDWAIHACGCGLATLCNGSQDGLDKFAAGSAAMAGIHLPEADGWNTASVDALGVPDAVLITWAVRKRGLLVSGENASSISSVGTLKGKRFAMRQPGAGAALLFSRLLKDAGLSEDDLACSQDQAHTESDAAAMVAAGDADAALGIQAMAKQFKLTFIPLIDERFDLLVNRRSYFTEPMQTLLTFARSPRFLEKAETLGGYALEDMGTVRWLSA